MMAGSESEVTGVDQAPIVLFTVVCWTATHDGGYWANDWDGELHTSRDEAELNLREALADGWDTARIATVAIPGGVS